jgi:hypothetical protein
MQVHRRLGDGGRGALGARQVIGHAEASEYLVTEGLVHSPEDNLVQVDIGTNAERWLVG